MAQKRKKRLWERLFGKKVKIDNVRVQSKKLKIGKKEYIVYSCGSEVVVYKGDDVAYNSVISEISFAEWKKLKKKQR